MVQAVIAIEDRRFFEHGGINYGRTLKCAVHDILSGRKDCGGSTITQQLAKNFFLSPEKTVSRKIAEVMITFQLESRFDKKQIFEMYANEINIGQRGSFAVNGFGEAAQAYFGKDLRNLNLDECATIAGIINRPNKLNPYRHPEAAMARRNLVLDSMVETGAHLRRPGLRGQSRAHSVLPRPTSTPVKRLTLSTWCMSRSSSGSATPTRPILRCVSTPLSILNCSAQPAAAVEVGMRNVDEMVRKRHKKGDTDITYPQVALIALNPHTGQVLALVGGRNYGISQLNHAVV